MSKENSTSGFGGESSESFANSPCRHAWLSHSSPGSKSARKSFSCSRLMTTRRRRCDGDGGDGVVELVDLEVCALPLCSPSPLAPLFLAPLCPILIDLCFCISLSPLTSPFVVSVDFCRALCSSCFLFPPSPRPRPSLWPVQSTCFPWIDSQLSFTLSRSSMRYVAEHWPSAGSTRVRRLA